MENKQNSKVLTLIVFCFFFALCACRGETCWFRGECFGGVYDYENVSTPNQCLMKCRHNKNCTWFTYEIASKYCYYYEECTGHDRRLEYVSANSSCLLDYGTFLIVGGLVLGEPSDYVELFSPVSDPSPAHCTRPKGLKQPTAGAMGFRYDNGAGESFLVLCGGENTGDKCLSLDKDNTWRVIGHMREGRASAAIAPGVVQGFQWITGGRGERGTVLSSTEYGVLDERGSKLLFYEGPRLPEPLSDHCMEQIDEKQFLIAGGTTPTGDVSAKAWLFDGEQFSRLPDMLKPRTAHSCIKLPNADMVLIAGGIDAVDTTISVEMFNLNDGRFEPGDSLPFPLYGATFIQYYPDYYWYKSYTPQLLLVGGADDFDVTDSVLEFESWGSGRGRWYEWEQEIKLGRTGAAVIPAMGTQLPTC